MENLLKDKMQKMVDLAMDLGVDSCDVISSKGESFSLNAQNAKIDKYQVSGSQVIGLRVIKDKKIGLSYTESIDDESLVSVAKFALENAKNSEANEFEAIETKDFQGIDKTSVKKDTSSTQEKIDFSLMLESEVKKREAKVSSVPYSGFSEVSYSSQYMNSLNTYTFEDDYYQSCYSSALINEGAQSSMHYHGSIGRSLKELDAEICIKESLEHAREWLTAKPVKTGTYDIIFNPNCFASVFGCFSNIFSAKAAMEKSNPFADELQKQVASSKLNIKDIPEYSDSFFKSKFDSEGTPHQEIDLIKDGVLTNFYHNSATANFYKTKSNGFASRSAKSALGVSGTTKVILAGEVSSNDCTSGEYLEIHSLQGLHSGANAISGDFSFGATGYLMRDNKRIQPVKGVTVSGNFHKMLKEISIIGDAIKSNSNRSFFSPILRFENISIAGA